MQPIRVKKTSCITIKERTIETNLAMFFRCAVRNNSNSCDTIQRETLLTNATASEDLSFYHVILYVLERRIEWQRAVFNKENEKIKQ